MAGRKNGSDTDRISRFMSYILRHHPEAAGISLDEHGWADVDRLISEIQKRPDILHDRPFDKSDLDIIVATNNKKRYEYSEDGKKIRARQGHSIPVDVELKTANPPDTLYHGTAEKSLPAIQGQGLKRMQRNHVHLSLDYERALEVGRRHGKPVVFAIDAAGMAKDGYIFYLSNNGIWLTETVPPKYLSIISHPGSL